MGSGGSTPFWSVPISIPYQTFPFPTDEKKPWQLSYQGFLIISLTTTYSHMGSPTLPSAMALFTSEFGMGSGGSTPLWSSSNSVAFVLVAFLLPYQNTRRHAWIFNNSFWNNVNQVLNRCFLISYYVSRPPWMEEVLGLSGTTSSKNHFGVIWSSLTSN